MSDLFDLVRSIGYDAGGIVALLEILLRVTILLSLAVLAVLGLRRSKPTADSCWHSILQQLLDQCKIRRLIEIRQCSQISVPMTWSLLHPVILDPQRNHRSLKQKTRCALITLAVLFVIPCAMGYADAERPSSSNAASAEVAASFSSENDPNHDLQITLTADKKGYFLGENIILHYCIKNHGMDTFYINRKEQGKEKFSLSMGGDSRNSARRSLRFKVEAVDDEGRKAEDPYPNPGDFGGMSGIVTLKPGEQFCEDLQLMRYREPAKLGNYTIKVYHDLGWEQTPPEQEYKIRQGSDIPTGPHKAPIVATTIRLRMPDEKQARQIVEESLKLPTDSNRTWGKRGQAFADFELIRYPVYLPIMRELADKGDVRGLTAIGAMAFPEATQTLLELAALQTPEIAAKAEELLLQRMPLDSDPKTRRPTIQDYLAERSWRADLKERALQLGWRLLADEDRERRVRGARIVQLLGGKDDLPRLIEVMNRLLPAYKDNDTEQRMWLRPASVSETLSRAASRLIERGATPPTVANTPGRAIAFLAGLRANKDFRPTGWQRLVALLLKHDIPFVRALALQNMTLPLADADVELVASLIKDEYDPVQDAACNLAGKSKLPRFRQPLTELLQNTANQWILGSAFHAADACGSDTGGLLKILVDRLEPHGNDLNMVLLTLLIERTIKHEGGSGAQSHADWQPFLDEMQSAWREFIEANRQEFQEGHRFKPGDPELDPKMFPPGFYFSFPKNGRWPEEPSAPFRSQGNLASRSPAVLQRTKLDLLSLPNPRLKDCRQAIRDLEGSNDWQSLAKVYEVTVSVMGAIITAAPQSFTRPAPLDPPGGMEGGPTVEVQTNLDGDWQKCKGTAENWLDWIKRKQQDIKLERFSILHKLAEIYRDRLDEPKKALTVLRESLADVPFFTISLEKLIANEWPLKKRDVQREIELGIHRPAARDLAALLEKLGDLDAAIDMQNRVVLIDYSVAGVPHKEIEKLYSLLRMCQDRATLPLVACLNLLSPERPSIEFDLDKLYGTRTEHKLWQLLIAAKPGCSFATIELVADMESKGGYLAVDCQYLREGSMSSLGAVSWYKDQRKGREVRTATFKIPEGVGVIYFGKSWIPGTDPEGIEVHRITVKSTFRAASVKTYGTVTATTVEESSSTEVRRKIAALAMPDETAPYDEQAVNWLSKRRQQITPQLIAALDDANSTTAEKCLDILRDVPASKSLTDTLVAKAGDKKSPLRYKALRQLEKSAADPLVGRLFEQASAQADSFPDPLVRARWAWLSGHKDRAVEILMPQLQKIDTLRFEHVEAIRLLGQIGDPAGIELLKPIAAGDHWGLAVEAYKALAKIDIVKYGLTNDQEVLLNDWRAFKETSENFHRRMDELAKLNVKEVRRFVMQMLRDKDYAGQYAALLILAAWKDKEALPQIRSLMQDERSYCRQQAVTAYLTIDGRGQEEVLNLLTKNNETPNDAILRGIVSAAIPADDKVTMLRAAQAKMKASYAVPWALGYAMNQAHDIQKLLVPLMDEETDLQTLAGYCGLAARDKEKRFAAQVRRAMKLLSGELKEFTGSELADSGVSAAQIILETVAAYDLKDLAPEVQLLMRSQNAAIRSAAQAAGAKLAIPGAMKDLFAQLGAEDVNVRKQAANSLLGIKLTDPTQRAAREEAVLACLGKPSEDYALRLLATCGSEKAMKALKPLLDDRNPQRAVYAAWVLAQLPDKAATAKGMRRVAIFAMFHHQMYQQGAGIDFSIAPELSFHQVTQRLNPEPKASSAGEGPVQIPAELLAPFALDDAEQQYAVRCYQLAEIAGNSYGLGVHFLDRWRIWMGGPQSLRNLDKTYLPLLKEIATHDSHLERLMVKGQAVAHFKYRQLAAKAISTITKGKATYLGLAGETLDSEAFPQLYKNQDQLLAKFVVDRVQKARLPDEPQSDRQWGQFEMYRTTVLQLQEKLGGQLLDAIRHEANQQKVDMKNIVPTTDP